MKMLRLKRLMVLALVLCLVCALAGCSVLRRIRTGKETEEDGAAASVSDTKPDGSESPVVDTSVVVDPADESSVEKLSEDQKQELETLLSGMEQELTARLSELGVELDIDEKTCEVALPASILFPGDSAELSQSGKDFLAEYVGIYNDIVLNSEYNKYVGYILIQGHTAPLADSTYESGLPLSRDRANAVREFILSEQAGTSPENAVKLGYLLVSEGCSNERPVLKADGTVDLAASRRVTFRVLFHIPEDN